MTCAMLLDPTTLRTSPPALPKLVREHEMALISCQDSPCLAHGLRRAEVRNVMFMHRTTLSDTQHNIAQSYVR